MKKITENELLEKVSKLREYIAVVESEQHTDEGLGDALAKYAAPIGTAIKTGAGKAVDFARNALGSTAGKVAAGAAAGAGALTAGQALTKPGQAAAPAGTTKPAAVAGKPDPNVKALQDKLIAAGAKIKADGIMGPATAAAQKQFPQAAGATAPPAAVDMDPVPASANASSSYTGAPPAAPAAAPAATGATMDDSDDVYAKPFVPPAAPAGTPPAVGTAPVATNAASLKAAQDAAAGNAPAPAVAPAAAPSKAQQLVTQAGLPQPGASADDMMKQMQGAMGMDPAKMVADQQARLAAMKAKQPAQSPQGTWTQQGVPAATQESVSFKNDELSRILSLVQHR